MMPSTVEEEEQRQRATTPPPTTDDSHRLHLLDFAGKLQCSLHLQRFQFIETAEDPVQWANRVRRQWGGSTPTLSLRVTLGTRIIGLTPPQAIDFGGIKAAGGSSTGFSGNTSMTNASGHQVNNRSGSLESGGGASSSSSSFVGINWLGMGGGVTFDLPNLAPNNAMLTLEILNFATVPPTLSGISVIHAAVLSTLATSKPGPFSQRRPTLTQRFAVHCFPNANATIRDKDTTTHAVLMAEVRITSLAAAALLSSGGTTTSGPPSRTISRTNSFSGNPEESFTAVGGPTNTSITGASFLGMDPLSQHIRGPLTNSSLVGGGGPSSHALSALDFNFGAVRLSTTSLYFPTTFLTSCGSFVVSNVLCVMNNTENSMISLRIIVSERNGGCMAAVAPEVAARNRGRSVSPSTSGKGSSGASITTCKDLLLVHPREAVTLRPQQRAFFSITWGVGKSPISSQSLQHNVAVQLQVQRNADEPAIAPIDLELHCAQPQPDEMHKPFHYWVNTTMVSNRPLHDELELPYVRSVLPVFLLLQRMEASVNRMGGATSGSDGSPRGSSIVGSADATAQHGEETLFIRDKDKGGLVMIKAGGHAKTTPGSSFALGSTTPSLSSAESQPFGAGGRPLQPWEVRLRSRPPKVDVSLSVVRCVVHMGQLRGLPMVVNSSTSSFLSNTTSSNANNGAQHPPSSPRFEETTSSTGNTSDYSATQTNTPAFRVSISPLQSGWTVTRSDTTPAYQAQSGALNWVGDYLEVIKQPGANTVQCLRLDLYEVNLADDDAIPIGSALISIPSTPKLPEVMRLPVAFYVYDSYSMYDKLSTTSLLFKDVALELHPSISSA
ncbi:Hypothetical protein, putative [Bodo saltans]|uniref:Uncharacterized protein n=1 Tax=Bodo saltans TaxID=75058 RepID=A0A0S4J7N2_BODSA|nr:Hypothetical protein, putative [Bodo saltans]|eukprot:CUG86318.1 Hypothetical protein, putative [Bodo saltans]